MRFKLSLVLAILFGLTYSTYLWVSSLPETSDYYDNDLSPSIELGEKLFWERGRCHVCHRIGDRGYALRGPNLGESDEGPVISFRAHRRAQKLGLATATDYLVQSVIDPGAFVLPRYQNEMPRAHEAPVSLNRAEIISLILYLRSLDGDSTEVEINLPSGFSSPARIAGTQPFKVSGDIEAGRRLFFDLEGPAACAGCHPAVLEDGQLEGAQIGPDLSKVASIRTARDIYEKIVNPDSYVVSGYEQVLLRTNDQQFYIGLIADETPDSITLRALNNDQRTFAKQDIAKLRQSGSAMPTNYSDLLSAQQLNDLMAYLMTLKDE